MSAKSALDPVPRHATCWAKKLKKSVASYPTVRVRCALVLKDGMCPLPKFGVDVQ